MKRLRSISAKLYFLVALSALSLAAVVGTAIPAANEMSAAGARLYQTGVLSKGRAERIAILWERALGQVTRVPAELDLEKQKQYQAAFAAGLAEIRTTLAADRQGADPAATMILADIDASLAKAESMAGDVFRLAADFVQDQAVASINGPFAEAEAKVSQG
ncbi:MAG: hypothetical protein ACHQAQ_07230, partial [Hyphomicrobiales bacterium]